MSEKQQQPKTSIMIDDTSERVATCFRYGETRFDQYFITKFT